LFARDKMNDSTILSGHVAAYYHYSGQVQMLGLGVIRGQVRGLMQYNVLLMDDGGLPLGGIDQQ